MKNVYEAKPDFTSDNFPLGEYFLHHFKAVPNVLFIEGKHSTKINEWLKDNFSLLHEVNLFLKDQVIPQTKLYRYETISSNIVVELKYDMPFLFSSLEEQEDKLQRENIDVNNLSISVRCFYQHEKLLEPLLEVLKNDKYEEKFMHNLSIIAKDEFGLRLREFKIESDKDLKLELNYGKKFLESHKTITKGLENNNSGLVLLHGKPGTGKTTYIRHLINKVRKKIIFVPPFMTEALTSPDFIPFLMNYPNSILVIEDAEKVVGDRKNGTTHAGVSNILNLTDGLLSDCLKVKILATFNMEKRHIDEALMRKGRLIAEHEFLPLAVKDVKKLFKELNIKDSVTGPMSLADIYNYGKKDYKIKNKSIGFNK